MPTISFFLSPPRLKALLALALAALLPVATAETVPASAFVALVPLTVPPAVLM